jgi:pilus assembly protein CpaB
VRKSTIVMIGFAVVFGLLAVVLSQAWLNRQAELRLKNMEPVQKPVATRTIVVANAPLRFGVQLSAQNLREVPWPQDAIPPGTFASINELLSSGRRIVLAAIERNEPVIGRKITGPGQRATLSAVIEPGLRAVTIRVSDVEDVAGFVLPGDHVDVLLTRHPNINAGDNDVVLQDAKVLAVDQLADDSTDKPAVVKAVTLEVDTVGAQKLSLAGSIGALSLSLRKAGEVERHGSRRITMSDLGNPDVAGGAGEPSHFATVAVTRATQRQEYAVPSEGGVRTVEGHP